VDAIRASVEPTCLPQMVWATQFSCPLTAHVLVVQGVQVPAFSRSAPVKREPPAA